MRLWGWLYDSVDTLKFTELYTQNSQTFPYASRISIKLF